MARLGASGSIGQSLDVSAPSTPGTYYYGACVESMRDESDTTDNCSSSVQIKVPQPDLVVAAPSVSNSAPAVGATFTLSATVSNDGDEASAVTTLRYYRSTDATITTSDTEVGTDVVAGLDPSGSGSQSARLAATAAPGTYYYQGELELAAPSSPGTYYYGACVDAVTDESDTINNCSSSVPVTVRSSEQQVQGTPDLKAYVTVVSTGLDRLTPGVSFTLTVGVRNDGDGASAATTLRYYRSTDATITTADTGEGMDPVPGLAPSATSSQSVELTAPSTPGTYYYGACVDAVTGRVRHQQQLRCPSGRCECGVAGRAGLGGGVADGEQQRAEPRRHVHPVCDGAKRTGTRPRRPRRCATTGRRMRPSRHPTRKKTRTRLRGLPLREAAASR